MSQTLAPDSDELIYDWNQVGRRYAPFGKVEFFDETLRDGIQNPSVRDPSIEDKLKILHLMNDLGIHAADIGLPGSNKRAFDDVLHMSREHEVDMRTAAYMLAVGRVAEATLTRGIYP